VEPAPADIRATLPASLREQWGLVAALDTAIRDALAGEDATQLSELAERRQRAISELITALSGDPRAAGIQPSVIAQLIRDNDELLAAGRAAASSAARVSGAARHQREAISAYRNLPEG